MKKCPFCAEMIQDEAIKCRYCSEFLDGTIRPPPPPPTAKQKLPRYFQKDFIILSFCCVGPFALPLIWWHPHMPRAWKIAITLVILIASVILTYAMVQALKAIHNPIDEIWNSR